MSVGVVIVSYNTCALLRACLASLRACTLPLQAVVVDNGSHDGSPAMVRAEFPEVTLVAAGRNLGFAAGNNVGMRALGVSTLASAARDALAAPVHPAGGPPDYLLLLNPDTVVHAGAIEALVAFLDAHPRVAMAAPRLLNPDGTLQPAAFRFPTLAMTVLDLFPPGEVLPGRLYHSWWHGRYPQERQPGAQPFPIDHPLGACMLVRTPVVQALGGMDEGYVLYSEEVEWCWRMRRAGWAIWQVPAARVTHVAGASSSQVRARALIRLYASRRRFLRQHYPRAHAAAHEAVIQAGMLRAVLRAWWDYRAGRLAHDDMRARLWAYGSILRGASC